MQSIKDWHEKKELASLAWVVFNLEEMRLAPKLNKEVGIADIKSHPHVLFL